VVGLEKAVIPTAAPVTVVVVVEQAPANKADPPSDALTAVKYLIEDPECPAQANDGMSSNSKRSFFIIETPDRRE
jgi:hypothetical protein